MTRLHRFLVGLAATFLVLEGSALLLGVELGSSVLQPLRRYVFAFGTMFALVGLLLWWTSSRVNPAKDRVWFKGEGGRISIGLDIIERHLAEVADEFPSIQSLDSKVTPAGRGLDIELAVRLEQGTVLPDVTRALQQRARESLSETMGPFAVRKIHVRVDDVGPGADGTPAASASGAKASADTP